VFGVEPTIEIRGRFKWTGVGFDQSVCTLSPRENFLALIEEVPDHVGKLEEPEVVRERDEEDRRLLWNGSWGYIELSWDGGRRSGGRLVSR